ncbi:uncharacterized protein B0P05DRAFT_534344 [Gilbertella persicaria]|uniref:uncharacterized protein n=1 Tax=Gilbertella persicaria TaxID=101096 RepID=UPI002220D891|nr:uncharacterized protein B0P05DRAFT_534344 [Gilbertella persicaria]KAI8085951.1 hypothetical protein B0P05DRAFT_534344 [Gilbertella persicaria]
MSSKGNGRGVEWTELYEALKNYYYSYDKQTRKLFDLFYDSVRFFSPEAVTNGIPLCIGISKRNGRYEIILPTHIYEQLLMFIEQSIPNIPPFDSKLLAQNEYEIVERFEANTSKVFSRYYQKVKTKNRQMERLQAAKREASQAKELLASKTNIFVSIDIEAYELQHSILLEIGWSMYDSKTGLFMDQHYINDQYRHLKNSRFVDDQKEHFNFGISVWCSLDQALVELRKDLDWAVERDGEFILVGHGLDSDLKYLAQQKFHWPDGYGGETLEVNKSACKIILNTDNIYAASINDLHNPPSLGGTLNILGVDTWNLHNAGNDAHYTLLLLMKLAGNFS